MLYIDFLGNIWNFELISKIELVQEPRDFEIIAVGVGFDNSNNCIEIFPTKALAIDFMEWLAAQWAAKVGRISYNDYCKDSEYKQAVDELLYRHSLNKGTLLM